MFGDGRSLVLELAPHKANVILLAEGGLISGSLRFPKGAKERLAPGRSWTERRLPEGRRDPFGEAAEAIDAWRALDATPEQSLADDLERRFIGLGSAGAEAAVAEHLATGRSLGTVLRERLDSILDGTAEVVIEGSRLLPWRPLPALVGRRSVSHGGAAVTAALYYEGRDEEERVKARIAALGSILRSELSRSRGAERKVREGLRSFADPDRHQRMGEALLASLSFAKRSGDVVFVADPYDPDGRQIAIPAPPGKSLAQVADDLFRLQRRSRRGLAAAGARAEALSQRVSRLEALLSAHALALDPAGADSLEHEMRREGLPVGLTGPTRSARAAARVTSPKLAGVRMVTSADGWTILVGRTSRDNDRLTFKIAAPDDFWLHAAGAHGAHVVIRNPDRAHAAPAATLTEAAGLALWFSDARQEAAAEVHWTRRKYVRRAKGGPPGRVVLKRFETVRTRAQAPSGSD